MRVFPGQAADDRRLHHRRHRVARAHARPPFAVFITDFITDHASWHWLFYVNLVPGLFVAAVVPLLVHIDRADFSLVRDADFLAWS